MTVMLLRHAHERLCRRAPTTRNVCATGNPSCRTFSSSVEYQQQTGGHARKTHELKYHPTRPEHPAIISALLAFPDQMSQSNHIAISMHITKMREAYWMIGHETQPSHFDLRARLDQAMLRKVWSQIMRLVPISTIYTTDSSKCGQSGCMKTASPHAGC